MRADEKRYYELLAPEYEDWALAQGRYAPAARPEHRKELAELVEVVAGLPPGRVLDVGCGTGIFTRHLRGRVVGLDQSERMVELARRFCPQARFVRGDALELPFEDSSFDLVLAAHFYSHLRPPDRERFLRETRRVAPALVVVDSALRPGIAREGVQRRALVDGSTHEIYKRFFRASELAAEVGGERVLFDGEWFVAVGRGLRGGRAIEDSRSVSLGSLAESAAQLVVGITGDPATLVHGVSDDWRRVRDGDLFVCLDGADAPRVAAAAAAMGAAALCVEHPTGLGLPELVVTDVRRAISRIAAESRGRRGKG